MIDINVGTLEFRLSSYEREYTEEDLSDDWIKTFVEYKLPVLTIQYSTAFTVSELINLKDELQSLYESLIEQKPHSDIFFDSLERHFSLQIRQVGHHDAAEVNIMMKPEDNADSVKVTDTFYLDQSYFPALLSGLDEMINWQN
ncbi:MULTISPECIES: hypothetical protein [Serratia]|uniref:WapI family immunity protein n=1 Tax=Serratia TaxID=613 RepID=UPI0018D652E6|nr:hypothetical protein [Serratia plymuthica]MEE4409204.1 hypothetical protein [Serratia sp. C2(2)]MEE4446515.1 hypothetical protein [Serratia sp. C2(1)]QPS53696.1 hypothetical protein I6G53_13335 [Serratia plymuthica]UNK25775.1 hypothetical protein MNO11_12950 [Serratia plymuthica]CAI1592967.1 Uncharacterised protein [Serratia plymuthica]